MSEPLVFVVDDDPSARLGMARLLRAEGHRVEALASATEFIDREPILDSPSCLVLDLRMPGMSGLELQERLHDRGHDLPIVFVTGYGDVPSSVQAIKGGAVDFLIKPFDGGDLVEAVEVALERARREALEEHCGVSGAAMSQKANDGGSPANRALAVTRLLRALAAIAHQREASGESYAEGALALLEPQIERAAAVQKRLSEAMDRHLANLESSSVWARGFLPRLVDEAATGDSK
jgi:DNA-binding NtrC family response regulator